MADEAGTEAAPVRSKSGVETGGSSDVSDAPVGKVAPAACPAEVPIMATLVEPPVQLTPLATTKGPWGAPFGLKPSQPAVCVPRRFSVGTMMILVTACAMLLGILKAPASIRSSLAPLPRSSAASERVKCCCSKGPIHAGRPSSAE